MSADQVRKEHPLIDTTEPNLLEETFDYDLPPKIRFDGPLVEYIDGQPVEFDPQAVKTRDIFITDTTFRDGQQARPPYTHRPDGAPVRPARPAGRPAAA